MKIFLKHCLTGKDNQTFDVARVLLAVGSMAFVVYTGWTVFHTGVFDAQSYGTGFGLAMGGGGASIWAKAKTEPDPPSNS